MPSITVGIIDWSLFFLVNGILLYSAYSAAGFLCRRTDSLATLTVAAGLVYFALITVTVIFLGAVVQHLSRNTVVLGAVLPALLLLQLTREHRPALLAPLRRALREWAAARDPFLYLLVVLFLLQVGVLIAKVVWLPPHVWDVFYYHLAPAVEWYQQGRMPLAIDTPARHMNGVPLGMTVLSYWFFVLLRHDVLVELPMLLWALLLVPLVYEILRRSQVSPAWPLKFAILVFFVPIVLMQSITVKDHLGLNIALLAGLFFLAAYLQDGHARRLVLAGLAFGLMLGYKQAGLAYLGVSVALFLMLFFLERRRLLQERSAGRRLVRAGGTALLLTALVGGYWWVKRALLAGSQALLALPPPRPAADATGETGSEIGRFGIDALLANLGEFWQRIFDFRAPYGADLPGISGFGPQFVAFGLPALVLGLILLWRKSERRQFFYLFLVTSLTLFALFLVTRYSANPNSYRILSFLPMTMIPFAAILLVRHGLVAGKGRAALVNLVLLGSVLWNFLLILPPAFTNPLLFREYVSMDDGFRTTGTYTKWFAVHRPNLYRLLPSMSEDGPIAIVSQPIFGQWFRKGQIETWSYPYYDRRWRRRLVYFHRKPYLECAERVHVCRPTEALKQDLVAAHMRLVSVCPTNRCVTIRDPDFIELAPGFYYFRGEERR